MKTTQLFFLTILGLSAFLSNAQATTASTTNIVTLTSYLGSGATSNFDVVFKRNNIPAGKLATTYTNFGLNSIATPNSVAFGVNAGQYSSGTGFNTYIGQNAGKGQSATILNTGTWNTFIGCDSGTYNTSGFFNTFMGHKSGESTTSGNSNTYIGSFSGQFSNGGSNVYIGDYSGHDNELGSNNVFIGSQSGGEATGSNGILIGHNAGYNQGIDNKLIIENSTSQNPLIYGDFATDQLKFHGKVGIGGNSNTAFGNFPSLSGNVPVSSYNLFVKGGILTDEVRVSTAWADYVFAKDYKLPSLDEVEKHIQEKGHLMNVPSSKQVEEDGIELGEMAKIQQEKIEELTLYLIKQNKEIEELKKQVRMLINMKQ
jgi:hypothetical protein